MADETVIFELPKEGFTGTAKSREFSWILDEPVDLGGANQGPMPTEYVYGALGGCIAITLRMYAQRKKWDTGEIKVEVYAIEDELGQKEIHKKITFGNAANLTEKQINRLHDISKRCPVSKLLKQATPVILD